MKEKERDILARFAERTRAIFPTARIWAFGSRVRGNAADDSDLDVCVVLDELDSSIRRTISHIAWEIGLDEDMIISTVVFSNEQFENGPFSVSPLVLAIREEGLAA